MTITASNNDDDYYNWTTNTVDAGPWILIGVLIYSTLCIAILPVLITLGNKREKRINEQKALEMKNNNAATFDDSSSSNSNSDENNFETKSDQHLKQEKRQFHAPLTGGSKISGGVLRTSRVVTPTDKSTPYQVSTNTRITPTVYMTSNYKRNTYFRAPDHRIILFLIQYLSCHP